MLPGQSLRFPLSPPKQQRRLSNFAEMLILPERGGTLPFCYHPAYKNKVVVTFLTIQEEALLQRPAGRTRTKQMAVDRSEGGSFGLKYWA